MNHTNVIYTIISKHDKFASFPYPPLYQENDTDYICFTDNEKMKSIYWKIKHIKDVNEFQAEKYLENYRHKLCIAPNQILVNAKENSDFLITVPDIYEIIGETPDFENFVPTANPDGTYHAESNPEYHDGPYDGHPYLLTIGVPVSNQIGTIRRCLDGIKPILETLPAELLVIDTGSTDGTVEAAREYQARIINFPWCGNMSAARNFGIRNAKGAWYMSIDDDEWFESVNEIIDFFQSGRYQNYLFASYIQRNYHSLALTTYDENPAPRIAKITSSLHFEGRIHDSLVNIMDKDICFLRDVAHHTGFHRDSKEALVAKAKRNLASLYFDLYEYPKDLRYTYQIANEFNVILLPKYAAAYLYRGLSVNKEVNDMYYQKLLASHLMIALYTDKNPALFAHAQTCLSAASYTASELALIHYLLFELAEQLEYDIPFIEKEASAYEHYREEYLKNPNKEEQHAILHLDVCHNPAYLSSYWISRFALAVRKQDETEAEIWINKIELSQVSQGTALTFCNNIIYCNADPLLERGLQMMKDYIASLSREQVASFADAVWNKNITIIHDTNKQSGQTDSHSEQTASTAPDYQNSLGFVFFQHFIASADYDQLSIHMLYWLAILGEKLFLAAQSEEDDTAYLTIFLNYITALYTYAVHYYNPDRFPENSPLLPENIRAGYHIIKSLEAAESNHSRICMEHLKSALHTFPGFKKGITLLLDQLGNKTKAAPSAPENEIQFLADQLKQQARELIANGRLQEACAILSELHSFLPADEETQELLNMISSQHKNE